jgi:transposase
MLFDNYIALDWAQANVALAKTTSLSSIISVSEYPADLPLIKKFLEGQRGTTVLTFEETTVSQWLYVELRRYVDKIIVSDPHHNHLLRKGPKTDKIDASKLVMHLKAGYIQEVYHSGHKFMELRKIVSAYEDIVGDGVRSRNQRAALLRSSGKSKKTLSASAEIDRFILEMIDRKIATYEENKGLYHKLFASVVKANNTLLNLNSIPGIGVVSAVKIGAVVVEAHRFPSKYHFWSYCGLVKHSKISGGRSYGHRNPRCRKSLKAVFKIAALSAIGKGKSNAFRDYYLYLIGEKKCAQYNARHAVARKIAAVAYCVMKSGRRYDPDKLR